MSYDLSLKNGVKIPQIGLGTYQMQGDTCTEAVRYALDHGYRHVDTAEFYDNEAAIGDAIEDRDSIFLTSKVWRTNLHHDDVIDACNASLNRLDTEHLDLYLIHWPNESIPMEETFDALEELYEKGKIRAVGVSNFTITHLKEAMGSSDVPITMNQVEFHPFLYQEELLEFCHDHDIQLTAYAPIARNKVAENEQIQEIAERHGKTPAQVSLRWLLQHGTIAIPKASTEAHIEQNMHVFDFELSDEEMRTLNALPQERLIEPGFAEF